MERSYCHAAPDRSDTSFLVKETIDFCEANNPYFLARSVGQGSGSRSLMMGCFRAQTRGLGWVAGREWKLHVLLLAGREWKLLILLHRFVDKPLALHNFLLLPASPPHTPHTHTRRYLHPPQTGVAASGHLRERLWIRLGLRYGPCRRSHRFLVPLPCTDPHVPRRKGGRRKTLIVDVVVRQRSHT